MKEKNLLPHPSTIIEAKINNDLFYLYILTIIDIGNYI